MTTRGGKEGSELIILTAAFLVSAVLLVILRFWSRYHTAAKYGADDWLIVAGLVRRLSPVFLF